MASTNVLAERLEGIERRVATEPGAAQDDLEDLAKQLSPSVAPELDAAAALLQNEDFPGAAHILLEQALLIQRTASVALEVREQVRRRR